MTVPKPKPDKPANPDKAKKPKHVHGHLVTVSFPLVVRLEGNKETSFPVSATVEVSLNKKEAKFTDLRPGDNVFLKVDAGGAVTDIDARRSVPKPDPEPEPSA